MDELENINLEDYRPSSDVVNILKDIPLVLVVGPSGSGKDTLVQALLKTGNFYAITSHTTRAPRNNHGQIEVDGLDYNFISMLEAKEMLEKKEYIEAAIYNNNIYGTSVSELVKAKELDKVAITDLEVQGVAHYHELAPKLMAIFLVPPSLTILLKRLINRYGHAHDDHEVRLRLKIAVKELEELLSKSYYYPLINNDFADTMKIVEKIIKDPNVEDFNKDEALKQAVVLLKEIKDYLS